MRPAAACSEFCVIKMSCMTGDGKGGALLAFGIFVSLKDVPSVSLLWMRALVFSVSWRKIGSLYPEHFRPARKHCVQEGCTESHYAALARFECEYRDCYSLGTYPCPSGATFNTRFAWHSTINHSVSWWLCPRDKCVIQVLLVGALRVE